MSVRLLARALGVVVGPAIVLAGAARLLTPAPTLSEDALAFDRMVQRSRSEVVVVGASFAHADIEPRALADTLSPGGPPALVLQVSASTAPVWYALLKERVYGNGLSPALIVLPVSISTLMTTRLAPSQMKKLVDQMPVADEVVARRTLGSVSFPWFERVLDARGDVRDLLLHAFRDAPPRLLLGADRAAVEAAGAEVFGEHHEEAAGRALPTVEAREDDPVATGGGWMVDDPAESYLADIVALAEAHGARVAVVLPPTTKAKAHGQTVDPAVEARVVAWAAEHGVAWVDHRGLPWDESHFRDGRHMRTQAARTFTELVAGELRTFLDEGHLSLTGADRPVASRVERTGEPPALPPVRWVPTEGPCNGNIPLPGFEFLGKKAMDEVFPRLVSPIGVWEGGSPLAVPLKKGDCTGTAIHRASLSVSRRSADGPPLTLGWAAEVPAGTATEPVYWVYPGTTLTWTFFEDWPAPPRAVELAAGAIGPGGGAPVLLVGDVATPVQVNGHAATASAVPPTSGRWTVGVRSPPDGPFLVIRSLGVRVGEDLRSVVAPPAARSLDVFQKDGWTVTGAVPAPPVYPVHVDGPSGWFEIPWKLTADCSPLRVRRGAELLPEMPKGKRREGTGTRLAGGRLSFDVAPGTDGARDYAAVYDPDPRCAKVCKECLEQAWLYPGQSIEAEIPDKKRVAFAAPVVRLRLDLTMDEPAPDPAAPFSVRVRVGEEVLAERVLTPGDFDDTVEIPLARPVAPSDPGPLRVAFSADPHLPPVLLMSSFVDQ